MNRARFLGLFLDEARQILARAYRDLERFESRPQQAQTLRALMRHCHSLKGMASTMSFEPYAEMAHRMESLLGELERRPRLWSNELAPLFHDGLSQLNAWTEAISEGQAPARGHVSARLIGRFDSLVGERSSVEGDGESSSNATGPARWELRLRLQSSSGSPTQRIVSALRELARLGRVLRVRPPQLPLEDAATAVELELELLSHRTPEQLRRKLSKLAGVCDVELTAIARRTRSRTEADAPTVWTRVSADSLDSIADTLRELAVREDLRVASSRQPDDHTRYLIRRLYDRVAEMRLVPVASLGHRLEPAVRDAARREGKRARFSLSGGEIGLERALLDRLVDPLRHLVRNAVAHGIETEAERKRAGKPAIGRVDLAVSRSGGRLKLEVSDDGAGVDFDAVRRAAVESGAVAADAAATTSENECLDLVFQPAITTRTRADRVAGRGAGLDVVTAELATLDAEISLSSRTGHGTRFRVELPLRQAVVQTLVFSREGQIFGIPLNAVLRASSSSSRPRGLRVVDPAGESTDPPLDGFLLELDEPDRPLALLADEILGRRDLWFQPVVRSLSSPTYVHGAAIVDHGELALILDPKRLAAET